MEADINSASVLMSAYTALGDVEGMRRAAQRAFTRAEAILAHDQNNSMVAGYSAYALAALGEGERAKARMERALLIDPENFNMRYNFACALSVYLKDKEAALDMLGTGVRIDHGDIPALRQGRPGSRPAARRSPVPGPAGDDGGTARGESWKAGDRRDLIKSPLVESYQSGGCILARANAQRSATSAMTRSVGR